MGFPSVPPPDLNMFKSNARNLGPASAVVKASFEHVQFFVKIAVSLTPLDVQTRAHFSISGTILAQCGDAGPSAWLNEWGVGLLDAKHQLQLSRMRSPPRLSFGIDFSNVTSR